MFFATLFAHQTFSSPMPFSWSNTDNSSLTWFSRLFLVLSSMLFAISKLLFTMSFSQSVIATNQSFFGLNLAPSRLISLILPTSIPIFLAWSQSRFNFLTILFIKFSNTPITEFATVPATSPKLLKAIQALVITFFITCHTILNSFIRSKTTSVTALNAGSRILLIPSPIPADNSLRLFFCSWICDEVV
jgi:hypothetical protein